MSRERNVGVVFALRDGPVYPNREAAAAAVLLWMLVGPDHVIREYGRVNRG